MRPARPMIRKRAPRPALRPFVETIWAIDETHAARRQAAGREHVLPTGQMHIALRLANDPLRLFAAPDDECGRVVGPAVVGGARASFYVREVSRPLCSVGAQLRPGAAEALFGVPAHELAERHTPLDALWGAPCVASTRGQLAEIGTLDARLDAFEALLAARLPRARGVHPAVAQALDELAMRAKVREVVRRSGYSHRRFIALFERDVGLTPKVYSRLLRFQRALRGAAPMSNASWADVAMVAGYSDQSHFVREFRELTGVSPTAYRRASPGTTHHLPRVGHGR